MKVYLKNLLLYCTIIFGVIMLGSLPWIIINPIGYIKCVFVSQGFVFLPYFQVPNFNSPIHWYSFLAGLNLPYWIIYILGFLTFSTFGIIIVEIIVIVFIHRWYHQSSLDWLKFLDIITYTAFFSHFFFPRGVYKYYFTFHIPIIILWLGFHFKDLLDEKKGIRTKWLIYFIAINFLVLLIPRNFYLLFIWGIVIIMIYKNLKLNDRIEINSPLLE